MGVLDDWYSKNTSLPLNLIPMVLLDAPCKCKPHQLHARRMAKIGYGHICLREDNLSFDNNYIIEEL
jgi:hypothetical protein